MTRRIIGLLLALPLLVACEKKVVYVVPELTCDLTDAVLPDHAGATAEFTVKASGKWTLSTESADYTVTPTQGKKGETRVTVKALDANEEARLRGLGTITVRLKADGREKHIGVFQQPEASEQMLLMYFPWSDNLTSYFERNVQDMEEALAQGILQAERVLVLFMDTSTTASLFELCAEDGKTKRVLHKRYDPIHDFTTPQGIATILEDARLRAPAERYALTVSCHGMSWIPAARSQGRTFYGMHREKEHWEYDNPNGPVTRWFGGATHQTDIEDLAAGIAQAGMKMEYILLDDCYMASVEVAYALRHAAERLIASPTEVMGYGFPYAEIGRYMVGQVDYAGICRGFYDFYMAYEYPYGTISVTECSELEALAEVMRRINERYTFDPTDANLAALQRMDGYTPVRFYDLGDYVRYLCQDDPALLSEFETQLERTVPNAGRYHTPEFCSTVTGVLVPYSIAFYTGMTISDPSISPVTVTAKQETLWWQATHSAE